jgi:hypothetical protein
VDQEAILRDQAETQLRREADQRRFLYRDVEALIEDEFLSHTLLVEGVPVTLRTLLPEEARRLRARLAGTRAREAIRWNIAASVWMVNGYEIPRDDPNASWHLYQEWVSTLPESLAEVLHSSLEGLQNRLNRAVRLTEAFCYEQYSRGLWRMLGRPQAGVDSNMVMRIWVAYNLTADQEAEGERQWSHTRAIVGSMSNKGAKHITKELDKIDKREKERQQRVIEEAVNWVIRGEEERPAIKVNVGGKEVEVRDIHSAHSVRDLEEEMRLVFSGEQDWHDYQMSLHQKRLQENARLKREEYQQKIDAARRRRDEAEEQGQPSLVGYTTEQLEKLRPGSTERKATTTLPASTRADYVYDRYWGPELRPGVLTPSLKVEDPTRQDLERLGSRKESVEEAPTPTLQERIANRKPRVGEP